MWIVLFACATIIFPAFAAPETHRNTILRRRASRLGEEFAVNQDDHATAISSLRSLFRPISLVMTVYSSLVLSAVYACFAILPRIFGRLHATDLKTQGLPFIGLIIGVFLASVVLTLYHTILNRPQALKCDGTCISGEKHKGQTCLHTSHRTNLSTSTNNPSTISLPSRKSRASKRNGILDAFGPITVTASASETQVAKAAAAYLNSQPANTGKTILPERIMLILHVNESFSAACAVLENLGLQFESTVLAKILVNALPVDDNGSTLR